MGLREVSVPSKLPAGGFGAVDAIDRKPFGFLSE